MTTTGLRVSFKIDTDGLDAAIREAGRVLAELCGVLKQAEHAKHQPPPIPGGRGAAYRARARRRTRSHR